MLRASKTKGSNSFRRIFSTVDTFAGQRMEWNKARNYLIDQNQTHTCGTSISVTVRPGWNKDSVTLEITSNPFTLLQYVPVGVHYYAQTHAINLTKYGSTKKLVNLPLPEFLYDLARVARSVSRILSPFPRPSSQRGNRSSTTTSRSRTPTSRIEEREREREGIVAR